MGHGGTRDRIWTVVSEPGDSDTAGPTPDFIDQLADSLTPVSGIVVRLRRT